MKHLLIIILLSFYFIHPALAAHMVPGTVPSVQPLRPPDKFAHPNVSGNVQAELVPAATTSTAAEPTPTEDQAVVTPAHPYQHTNLFWVYAALITFGLAILYNLYLRYVKKK